MATEQRLLQEDRDVVTRERGQRSEGSSGKVPLRNQEPAFEALFESGLVEACAEFG